MIADQMQRAASVATKIKTWPALEGLTWPIESVKNYPLDLEAFHTVMWQFSASIKWFVESKTIH